MQGKSNFEKDKEKVLEKLTQLFQKVAIMTRPSELDVVNKCIAPIEATLAALDSCGHIKDNVVVNNTPHNKKICQQRRLLSTKKKTEYY